MNVIDAQLAAYNRHDVEAFVRCFSDPVTWRGPDGVTAARTHEAMRASFGDLFARSPALRARVTQRIELGQWVIDVEKVSGLLRQDLSSVLIHRVVDEVIVEVIVLTGD